MDIKISSVPHKYRNRFLRDGGGTIMNNSKGSGQTTITDPFDMSQWFKRENVGTADEPRYVIKPVNDFAIKSALLSYDDVNAALKIEGNVYSTKGLSAFGYVQGNAGSNGSVDEVFIGDSEPSASSVELWVDSSTSNSNITNLSIDDRGHLIANTNDAHGVVKAKIDGVFTPVVSSGSNIGNAVSVTLSNQYPNGVEIGRISIDGSVFIFNAPKTTAIGNNVLTTENYAATLDGVYLPKGALDGYATEQWVNQQEFLTIEIDPIFTAHQAHNITEDMISVLGHLHMSDGKIYVDTDFYSTGGISAYGYNGGSGSSNVSFNQIYANTGEHIATITIDGVENKIYAPKVTSVPDNVLTTTNYAATLNSVYQPKGTYLTNGALDGYATQQWANQTFLKTYTETDPVFSASAASSITSDMIDVLQKLSLVDGKLKVDADMYATGGVSAYGYNGGSSSLVNVTAESFDNKVKIATINDTEIYAPKITITASLTSNDGTKIATIDGVDIYAPTGGDGGVSSVTITQGTGISVSNSGTAIISTGNRTISIASGTMSLINGAMQCDGSTTMSGNFNITSGKTIKIGNTSINEDSLKALNKLSIVEGSLKVDGNLFASGGISAYGYNGGGELSVDVEQVLTSGTEIAKVNGTSIYAPQSSSVNVTQTLTSGTKIAEINGVELYAPNGGNGGTVTSVTLNQGNGISITNSGTAITNSGSRTISIASATLTKIDNALQRDGSVAMTDYLQIPINKGIKIAGGSTFEHATGVQIASNGLAFWQVDESSLIQSHLSGYGGICLHTGASDAYVNILGNLGSTPQAGRLKIGDAVLTYDSSAKALKLYSATDGVNMNFYASGGISAYGLGSNPSIENLTLSNTLTTKNIKVSGTISSTEDVTINSGDDVKINTNCVIDGDGDMMLLNGNLTLGESGVDSKIKMYGSNIEGSSKSVSITNVYISGSYLCLTIDGVNKKISLTNNTDKL